jgi:hypothetical protein
LKTTLFDLNNRIKIVNFLSNHCFFFKVSSVCGKRKEPELEPEPDPQFVISAPAWGGNLISAPRLRIYNTTLVITNHILGIPILFGNPIRPSESLLLYPVCRSLFIVCESSLSFQYIKPWNCVKNMIFCPSQRVSASSVTSIRICID